MASKTLVFRDEVLADLFVQNRYFTAQQMAEWRETHKKLRSTQPEKNLEAVILAQERPAEQQIRLQKFLEFLRVRWHGIVFCQFAIASQNLVRQDLERVLITQRALFSLKNKIISLDELLLIKKKFTQEQRQTLTAAVDILTDKEYHKLTPDALQYLISEDQRANQWRAEHLQGIVGTKYRKASQEDDAANDGMEDVAVKKVRHAEKTTDNKDEAAEKAFEPEDAEDEEDQFDSPDRYIATPHHSITRLTIIITAIICLIAVGFILSSGSGPKIMFKEIAGLWENKKYPETEQRCRDFCKKYPDDSLIPQVRQYLQETLLIRADIAQRQGNWEESEKLLQEALSLQPTGEMLEKLNTSLKEVQQHLQGIQTQNEWQNNIAQTRAMIGQADFIQAQIFLENLRQYPNPSDIQKRELAVLAQEVVQAQEQHFQQQYRYIPKEELKINVPDWCKDVQFATVPRLPLQGRYKQQENQVCDGFYFTTAHGYLYALSANDGSLQWVEFLGHNQCYPPILFSGPRECTNLSLADRVLVVTYRNSLKMMAADKGNTLWETIFPEFISTAPMTYRGKIYIGCHRGMCYQIDSLSGQIEGAYRTPHSAAYPVSIDRSQKLLYITTRHQVYGYHLPDGKLAVMLESQDPIIAPVIAVAPYLILALDIGHNSTLAVYQVPKPNQLQPNLLKKVILAGNLQIPCTVAGGLIACATESQLVMYGIHPTNSQECLFPIGGSIPLEGQGPVFIQFTHFLQNLLVIQNKVTIYELPDFTANNTNIRKQCEGILLPLIADDQLMLNPSVLRSGDLLFLTQTKDKPAYYQVSCISIQDKQFTPIWQRQIAPSPAPQGVYYQDQRLMMVTQDGTWHDFTINSQNKLSYRMLDAGVTTRNPKICYVPEGEGYWAVTDTKAHLVDAITGWATSWQPEITMTGEFGKPIYQNRSLWMSQGSAIFSFSAKTGQKTCLEHSEFRGKPFLGIPVFREDALWIGNDNGTLDRFQLKPDQPLPFLQKTASWKTQGPVRSEPTIEAGVAYFGSQDQCLYAVDFKTQKLLWKFATQGAVVACPLLYQDRLYFGSEGRYFYAVEKATGNLVWKQQLHGKVRYPCVVLDDSIVATTQAGEIKRYNPATGEQVSDWKLPSPLVSSVVSLGKYLLAIGSDGFIYILKQ